MRVFLGVVGPQDLVDQVVAVVAGRAHVELVPLAYQHETEAVDLVARNRPTVDAWLFTGAIPFTTARDTLTAPASYLDYNGSTILQGLVRLLRDGRDPTRLSIDTLRTEDVIATFSEVGIPTADVRVLPYREGLASTDTIDFHRANVAQDPATVIVTCVSSVYERVKHLAPTLRLVPSIDAITGTVSELLLRATNQVSEQAQVAVGLVDFAPAVADQDAAEWISDHVAALGATVARTADNLLLVVTTRGALEAATSGFSAAPFLPPPGPVKMSVGFGVGNSATQAEKLARRALLRASAAPITALFVSFRSNADTMLSVGSDRVGEPPFSMGIGSLAARTGLSITTLGRVKSVVDAQGGDLLTTRDLAQALDVQQRTARRIIRHFEIVGLADRLGFTEDNQPGRPLTLYRIKI